MMRNYWKPLCAGGTLLSLLLPGCSKPTSSAVPPPISAPGSPPQANAGPPPSLDNTTKAEVRPTSEKDIQTAVQKAVKSNPICFPKDVRVRHISLADKVATIDLSSEFNALANMGDTTESDAQKALRAALKPFPDVEKMRVTVEGKPFDSQVTDWNTPFPVRSDGDASEEGIAPGSTLQKKKDRSMQSVGAP